MKMKTDPKIMDVLSVISPAIHKYFQDPALLKKAGIERYLSQADVPSAVALLKTDLPKIMDAFYPRTETLIRDVFDDGEIEKIIAITKVKEYQEARCLEDSLGKIISEMMKTQMPTRSDNVNTDDLEALKEYLISGGVKLKRSGLKYGDVVVLGRHEEINGDRNWSEKMEAFVGKEARIIKICSFDLQKCETARVDLDGGDFNWRTCNMRRVR